MKTDDTICKDNASEASAPSGNTMSAEPGPAIHHDTSVSEASAAAYAAAECRQDAAASASQVQKYVSIKNAVHDVKIIKYGYTADGQRVKIEFKIDYSVKPASSQSLRDASMEAQIQWSKQQYDRAYNEAAIIIRDQVRDELRAEMRDEIRNEVRDEVRDQVRDELRAEVRDEVRNEILEEIRNEVRYEVRNVVRAKGRDEVMKLIETCRSENMSDTQTLQRIIDAMSSKGHMQSSSNGGCISADGK